MNTEILKQAIIIEEKSVERRDYFLTMWMTKCKELCDDVVMTRDGKVVLDGSRKFVINMGKTRYLYLAHYPQTELEALPHVTKANLTNQVNTMAVDLR